MRVSTVGRPTPQCGVVTGLWHQRAGLPLSPSTLVADKGSGNRKNMGLGGQGLLGKSLELLSPDPASHEMSTAEDDVPRNRL